MANTFYSAQSVLVNFAASNEYVCTNMSLKWCGVKYSKMWVEEKEGVTSLLCLQLTRTAFEIRGYGSDYAEVFRTSFDYADVNTPPMALESTAYDTETE